MTSAHKTDYYGIYVQRDYNDYYLQTDSGIEQYVGNEYPSIDTIKKYKDEVTA